MSDEIHLLDVVALLTNLPDRNLSKGQVGTVVELLDQTAVEVEFTDSAGRTYALAPVRRDQLMLLHYEAA